MALHSSSLLDRELEEELVAIQTRPSRRPTPQSWPSFRMEELFSQMFRSQEAAARSLESMLDENTRSLAENTRPLESKLVENTRSLAENTRSLENNIADMAYKQVEQIAEISDLVDRISTVERPIQSSPVLGSNPPRRNSITPRHAMMARAPMQSSTSTYFKKKLKIAIKEGVDFTKDRCQAWFLGSPVEEGEEEEEYGFRSLKGSENLSFPRENQWESRAPVERPRVRHWAL